MSEGSKFYEENNVQHSAFNKLKKCLYFKVVRFDLYSSTVLGSAFALWPEGQNFTRRN